MNIQGHNWGNHLVQTRTELPGAGFSWNRYSTNGPKTEPLLTLPAIKESEFLIKNAHPAVWEEKKWGVEIPGHIKVKVLIERHLAMLYQNRTARCLPGYNRTAKNRQTQCRRQGTGLPQPDWLRQLTPWPTRPLSEMPPTPTGRYSGAQCSQIVNLLAGYPKSQTSLPWAEFFPLVASAHDSQHDTDCNPDILTDEGTSTG